jgi:hypothetical protein
MTLVDGWLWLFLGLMAVGFIILLLRKFKPKSKVKKGHPSTLFEHRQIQDWERRFSWRPVRTVDQRWIWLRSYWRRKVYLPPDPGIPFEENFTYQNVIKLDWYLW